jgi:hypothetical protein
VNASGHDRKQPDIVEVILLILKGSQTWAEELTREQAAQRMQPKVTERTLRRYLDLASLYLPSFAAFRNETEGGLNRYAKLTNWNITPLQRIRTYARTYGMKKLRLKLSSDPGYFEKGQMPYESEGSSREISITCQEVA